jgi:hypothetical protein
LPATGSLAQYRRTLGADGLGLLFLTEAFFRLRCMGGWKHQRNAHNKETKKLKERIQGFARAAASWCIKVLQTVKGVGSVQPIEKSRARSTDLHDFS